MASMPERIATLEAQMTHLVVTIDQHRDEAREAAKSAREDREVMQRELRTLTDLAADGKSRLAVLFWLASLFSGLFGGGIAYAIKTYLPLWQKT